MMFCPCYCFATLSERRTSGVSHNNVNFCSLGLLYGIPCTYLYVLVRTCTLHTVPSSTIIVQVRTRDPVQETKRAEKIDIVVLHDDVLQIVIGRHSVLVSAGSCSGAHSFMGLEKGTFFETQLFKYFKHNVSVISTCESTTTTGRSSGIRKNHGSWASGFSY